MGRDDQDSGLHGARAYTAQRARRRAALRVFLASLALLLLTTRGLSVADATLHLDVAVGLIERGSPRLSFDPGPMVVTREPLAGGLFHMDQGGGVRSSLPTGLSLVASPFVAVGSLVATARGAPELREVIQPVFIDDPARASYRALIRPINRDPRTVALVLVSALAGALAVTFSWLALAALGASRRARGLAAAALLLSPLGVYAGTCWTQAVTAAALAFATWRVTLSALGRPSSSWPVGLALGVAALVRPDHAPLVVPFVLALLATARGARRPIELTVGAVAPLLAAVLALVLIGVPRGGGGWSASTLPLGVSGLLVSPVAGLLVFAPFVLLAPLGLRALPPPLRALALVLPVQLAIYGGWFDWDATFAYGPRFLVPSLPVLALAFGLAVERAPGWARGSVLVGGLVSLPGLLLAHARIPESHDFFQPAVIDAWSTLLGRSEDAVGALGVDCAATYVPIYAWLALGGALIGFLLEARARRRGLTPAATLTTP